jgi:ketohexokinase
MDWIHFEGRIPEILADIVPKIQRLVSQTTFSLEIEKPDRHGLLDLVSHFDYIFFSHTYFLRSGYSTPEDFFASMRERCPSAVYILTAGEDGAYYSSPHEFLHIPTTKVDVVDATGAGDTFIAGFIWSMMKLHKSPPESVKIAASLATKKVGQEGFYNLWK